MLPEQEIGSWLGASKGRRSPTNVAWLYHATFSDRIVSIAEDGLVPSKEPQWGGLLRAWSSGKVFFSTTVAAVRFYAGILFSVMLSEQGRSPAPVLLRVPAEIPAGLAQDQASAADWYTRRRVPAAQIDAWVPWRRAWSPVADVAEALSNLETVLGDPQELDVNPDASASEYVEAFFQAAWPTPEEESSLA